MRGGATEVNETQKWATSKKSLKTTGLDDRRIGIRFALRATDFSLHRVQTSSGTHRASYSMGAGRSFPESKAA
jgi:hypothetical protein